MNTSSIVRIGVLLALVVGVMATVVQAEQSGAVVLGAGLALLVGAYLRTKFPGLIPFDAAPAQEWTFWTHLFPEPTFWMKAKGTLYRLLGFGAAGWSTNQFELIGKIGGLFGAVAAFVVVLSLIGPPAYAEDVVNLELLTDEQDIEAGFFSYVPLDHGAAEDYCLHVVEHQGTRLCLLPWDALVKLHGR